MADRIYTIPAPKGTLCPRCDRTIKQDAEIVRYDGRILHLLCFVQWFPNRKPCRGLKQQLEAFRVYDRIRAQESANVR